jgi:hypothetical protein
MNQTDDNATIIATLIQLEQETPKPEGYICCSTCGAILGYKAHVNGVLYLYLYSYPPHGICNNLSTRHVNARMLNGDAICQHCGTVRVWTAAANWPIEKPA